MGAPIILLGHGSGGVLSHQLLGDLVVPTLNGLSPRELHDAACLPASGGRRLAFTSDGYVVDPLFFPGGDIGCLAVNGTVNDLAMVGARPVWLSASLIIEEGLERETLAAVLASMRRAADAAGVTIVTGDTKVVPRGKADRLFITTAGIGLLEHDLTIDGCGARPGDRLLVSGSIGDHGIAVLAAREGLHLQAPVQSDCAPLHGLVAELLPLGAALHVLRDPTRGGLATTVKEIASQSGVAIRLEEAGIPVTPAVQGVCGLLGLDPLYVANEGKLLAIVAADAAEEALQRLRRHPLGSAAAIIGEVVAGEAGRVSLRTAVGGERGVEMLAGEQLPRIC